MAFSLHYLRLSATLLLVLRFSFLVHCVEPYNPQLSDPLKEPWRWFTYSELDNQGVLCVEQDGNGVIWFGTKNGIVRYDGWEWRSFSLDDDSSASVNDLFRTSSGTLLAGSSSGIYELDADGQSWSRIFPNHPDSIPIRINTLSEDSNAEVWAASTWGVIRKKENGWEIWSSSDMIRGLMALGVESEFRVVPDSVAPSSDWGTSVGIQVIEGGMNLSKLDHSPQIIWAVAPGGPADREGIEIGDRLISVNGEQRIKFSRAFEGELGSEIEVQIEKRGSGESRLLTLSRQRLDGVYRLFAVHDVVASKDKSVWIGTRQPGYVVRAISSSGEDGESQWIQYKEEDGLAVGIMPRIFEDSAGKIHYVTNDGDSGYSVFQEGHWTLVDLQTAATLEGATPTSIMCSIAQTRDGNVWIGGHDGQLIHLGKNRRVIYSPDQSPLPKVRLIDLVEFRNGELWIVGNGRGIVRILYDTKERWLSYDHLQFQAATATGEQWFIQGGTKVVVHQNDRWVSYDRSDGLIENIKGLILTADDHVIAFGSETSNAAIAFLNSGNGSDRLNASWEKRVIQGMSRSIDENGYVVTNDGSVWLGASSIIQERKDKGGILQVRGRDVLHHFGVTVPFSPYGMTQTPDGSIWAGGPVMKHQDNTWSKPETPEALDSWIHDMIAGRSGVLWIATRLDGVFRYLNQSWSNYNVVRDGLPDNRVEALFEDADGILWAGTPRGLSRFDGAVWDSDNGSFSFKFESLRGAIKRGLNRSIWINSKSKTIRYTPDRHPPDTFIENTVDEYVDPVSITLNVSVRDYMDETPAELMRISYRFDDEQWTPFRKGGIIELTRIAFGNHRLEVRSRDWDYNLDPEPPAFSFTVARPLWQRPWFVSILAALGAGIVVQSRRLVNRDKELALVNTRLRDRVQHQTEEIRRHTAAIEQTGESVVITDSSGNIEYVNPSFESITGYTKSEVVGRNPRLLKSGNHAEAFYHEIWQTLTQGKTWEGRFENRKKDGSLFLMNAVISPIRDEQGRLAHFVSVGRDVTQEAAVEKQLRQSVKMEAVGRLAGGIAHEFNNIMQVVLGYGSLLKKKTPQKSGDYRDLDAILSAASRASQLTKQLLSFSREQTPHFERLELNQIVSEFLGMLQPLIGEGTQLEFLPYQGPTPVTVDRGMLEQILMNLCLNGRDSIPKGGLIQVSTSFSKVSDEYCRLHSWARCGEYVVLSVRDSGCGIRPEDLDRVFEPFFTTKDVGKGTGLGLSTVYGLVEQHGGLINIASRVGSGTTIDTYFPTSEVKSDVAEPKASEQELRRGHGETILLAEDEPGVRGFVERFLTEAGYHVIPAENGREAIAKFHLHHSEIDLLLLDVIMPDVDGPSALAEIHNTNPTIPALFCTGCHDATDPSERDLVAGCRVIQKPFEEADLLNAIRKTLDSRK